MKRTNKTILLSLELGWVHTLGWGRVECLGYDRYGRPADEHGSVSLFPSLQNRLSRIRWNKETKTIFYYSKQVQPLPFQEFQQSIQFYHWNDHVSLSNHQQPCIFLFKKYSKTVVLRFVELIFFFFWRNSKKIKQQKLWR